MIKLYLSQFALLLCAYALVSPSTSYAQSCCTASSNSALATVGPCQSQILALRLNHTQYTHSVNTQGELQAQEIEHHLTQVHLGFGYRLNRSFQFISAIPYSYQVKNLSSSLEGDYSGLGDINLGVQYDFSESSTLAMDWDKPSTLHWGLSLRSTWTLPTGRSENESNSPTQADILGLGSHIWSNTLILNRYFGSFLWSQELGYDYAFGRTNSLGQDFQLGDKYSLQSQMTWVRTFNQSWGLNHIYQFQQQNKVNSTLSGSTLAEHRLGLYFKYVALPYWDMTVSLSAPMLIEGINHNKAALGPTIALTWRKTWI